MIGTLGKLPTALVGSWLNHCWAALAKVVTKTRHLIPSVYLCKSCILKTSKMFRRVRGGSVIAGV
ncbi:UNVERIFIED_CONTAM: hypothetical protein Slati_0109300 [Sesamum latifolium]|uniref:Secreted protein n=1 Tax=Sesamum latifolium TaxID=2727402 RepID=A0AAW2Y9U2_9LAMI